MLEAQCSVTKPKTQRNRHHQFQTELLTPRVKLKQPQCFITSLLKMVNFKNQQKKCISNLKMLSKDEKQKREKQMNISIYKNMRDTFWQSKLLHQNRSLVQVLPSYNNDKIIDKFKIATSKHQQINTRKNFYSCLDKCRLVTENYDELKKQIINKIKIKRSQNIQQRIINKIIQYNSIKQVKTKLLSTQKQKQNLICVDKSMYSSNNKKNRNSKHSRNRSLTQYQKKNQRYNQMSVAQFMEQNQSKISIAISRKFQQYRKQQNQKCIKNRIQQDAAQQKYQSPSNSNNYSSQFMLKPINKNKKRKLTIT